MSLATDAHWQSSEPLFQGQHFRKHQPRSLCNALFYLNKTGYQWRRLPHSYPPWQTVYYHFRHWTDQELFQRLTDTLRRWVCIKVGRTASPTAAIMDRQSVKTAHVGGERGFTFRESSI